jgi:CD2 antigen cytoplasmic tail-binding protein 2
MPVKRAAAGPGITQKRTRFASPSPAAESSGSLEADDAFLEEDLPEGAQRAKARSKRQLKDQDGYGSDSSNDDEGVVPSRRPGVEDEDVDMFADDVDEKIDKKGKGKEKEFMDLNDVEGQEFSKRDEEESDSEDEEDMDEKGKRKRGLEKDLGIEVTPFNMKNEMEEGRFTADGENYVANEKDQGEKHDMWLEDLDKEEIKKARKAHKERERLEREREERESGGGEEGAEERKRKEAQLMREAVELMQRGETVLEALQRLGKEVEDKRKRDEAGQKKKSWAERQKERKAAMAADQEQV